MISKQQKTELGEQVRNKELPLKVRKEAYIKRRDGLLNPFSQFNAETFDPYVSDPDYEIKKRQRVEPPRILPDMGMFPKEIMEGQMIGMYESKQDLYLLIAWLSRRVTELEELVKNTGGDSLRNKT